MKAPNQRCRLSIKKERVDREPHQIASRALRRQMGAANWTSTSKVTSYPKRPRGQGWTSKGEKEGGAERRTGTAEKGQAVEWRGDRSRLGALGREPEPERRFEHQNSPTRCRAVRHFLVRKWAGEVVANKGKLGENRAVEVENLPCSRNLLRKNHSWRNVTCLLLNHCRKSLGERAVKRSPRNLTSRLFWHYYLTQQAHVGGELTPVKSRAARTQSRGPEGGVEEDVAVPRKEGI